MLHQIIPFPVSVSATEGRFVLTPTTTIAVHADATELVPLAEILAATITSLTGYDLGVVPFANRPPANTIALELTTVIPPFGNEGYALDVTERGIKIAAGHPTGVFYGIQTLRQLLPHADSHQPDLSVSACVIQDYPRFEWRGVMLDVARHFLPLDEVKRVVDLMASYKLNRLHLHLSDDQGWRLMIESWPRLAEYGGTTAVGGGPGGYYTQAEYSDLVAYAEERHVMIIPEIDLPGHINAALAAYGELNPDGQPKPLYTGTKVGFSSLSLDNERTFPFIADVVRELAALTPGPYIHIGGDEASSTPTPEYVEFINRIEEIVQATGKRMMGWQEIVQAELDASSVVQYWNPQAHVALPPGNKVVLSPATRAYLDMKYDEQTELGLNWAGYIGVEHAYSWDPANEVQGVAEEDVLGIEAPLWTETIETREHLDSMVFPRLLGHAEIGWSPAHARSWHEYRERLGAHGQRLRSLGVNYHPATQVPWI